MKLLKLCIVFLVLFVSEQSMAQFSAGEDALACGTVDTLSATTITGGYWTVDDSGVIGTNCTVFLINSNTGLVDYTDPSAIVVVTCAGEWIFTWHEVDGENEETDAVSINFSESSMNIGFYPEENHCLDDVEISVETIGYDDASWIWMVDPNWAYIDEIPVSIDLSGTTPLVHKEFSNEAFGDSAHVVVPLLVTVIDAGCATTEMTSVTFYQRPEPFLGMDTVICGNELEFNVGLTISEDVSEQQWYGMGEGGTYSAEPDDEYNSTITASLGDSINIVFSEENVLGNNHPSCLVKDSIIVEFLQLPNVSFPESEMHVCGNCVELSATLDQSINSIGRWMLNPEGFVGFECEDNNIEAVVDPNAWFYHSTDDVVGVDTVYVSWIEYNAKSAQCFDIDSMPIYFWYESEAQILLNGTGAIIDSTCGLTYDDISANAVMPNNEYAKGTWRSANAMPVEWYKNGSSGAYNEPNLDYIEVTSIGDQSSVIRNIYWIIENGDIYADEPAVCIDTSEVVTIRFDNNANANILTGFDYPEITINCGDSICLEAENNSIGSSYQWMPNDFNYYKEGYNGYEADTLINPCLVVPLNMYPNTDTVEGGYTHKTIVLRVRNGACMDMDTVNIRFAPVPTGTYYINQPFCAQEEAVLMANRDINSGMDVYLIDMDWSFEEGDEPNIMYPYNDTEDTIAVRWTNNIENQVYDHLVNLRTTNIWGCESQVMTPDNIHFPNPAKVEWAEVTQPDPDLCNGMISYRNYGIHEYSLEWANNLEFTNSEDEILYLNDTIFRNDLCSDVYYLLIAYQSELMGNCFDTLQYVLFEAYNDTCNGLYSELGITYASELSEADGAIDVTAIGGTMPYTYNWSGPNELNSTEEDLNNIGAGLYVLLLEDAYNCHELRHVHLYAAYDSSVYDNPIAIVASTTIDTCLSFMPVQAEIYDYLFNDEEIIVKWKFVGEDNQIQFLNVIYDYVYTDPGVYQFSIDINCDLFRNVRSFTYDLYLNSNFDVSVQELKNTKTKVYPNPSSGKFYIETEDVNSMTLTDLGGRVIGIVETDKHTQTSLIDLSNQKSGIYLLHLKTDNGQQVVKLIKE